VVIGGDVSCERLYKWCIYFLSLTHSLGREGVEVLIRLLCTTSIHAFNIQNLDTIHIVIHPFVHPSVRPPLSSRLKFLYHPSRPSIPPPPSYAPTTITSHLHLHLGRRGTAQHRTARDLPFALPCLCPRLSLSYYILN